MFCTNPEQVTSREQVYLKCRIKRREKPFVK